MIADILKKLVLKENLTENEITACFNEIMEGRTTSAQTACFLTALRMKGETIDEITACVKLLKSKAKKLDIDKNVIDIVGTGGDGASTFNISTAAAFITAAGGVPVAKHGNRAASSKSGSADVLEKLGVNINLTPEENKKILDKTGICFMFAPLYNPALRNVLSIRSEIKIRTIFNALGPLINPSNAKMQIIGVYDKNLVEPVSYVMLNLGIKRGMVLFGADGIDEASISGITYYAEIKDNKITTGTFLPTDFNLKQAPISEVKGGEPDENALIMKNIFTNKIKGAKKDILCLNAGIGFYIAGKTSSIKEGVELADNLIKNNTAYNKLKEFIEETKRV